jgi:hypothetical protein
MAMARRSACDPQVDALGREAPARMVFAAAQAVYREALARGSLGIGLAEWPVSTRHRSITAIPR